MTRTERAAYPRAAMRDRSLSKSGLDNHLRKGGGGHHNWGKLAEEEYLEAAAREDSAHEFAKESDEHSRKADAHNLTRERENSTPEEDIQRAREIRKNALKVQGIDLATIARTSSAVSTSPTRLSDLSPVETSSAASI
ncbi:hypothetical protein PISMIDRAFT_672053 [Pisolithus microcarpus 441]|uniref:Hyaluronan/mRNA-binding protein domain-containing protein n=1 Tax=Pisolithus microcarpus 441 TaxID=765257 RepID=A0A0C9YWB6_9AGAM|nr:hypothetical protein BKA83DRAFT_672053 [Pisolithus microcarpus]KIK29380.1 hypothetical protein PISMIDRAFT_672053 [Pisolithus microcarpus 441]